MIAGKRLNRIFIYTSLILLSALFLLPAYMLIITAFKSPDQISNNTVWNLPDPWYFYSFVEAAGIQLPSCKEVAVRTGWV